MSNQIVNKEVEDNFAAMMNEVTAEQPAEKPAEKPAEVTAPKKYPDAEEIKKAAMAAIEHGASKSLALAVALAILINPATTGKKGNKKIIPGKYFPGLTAGNVLQAYSKGLKRPMTIDDVQASIDAALKSGWLTACAAYGWKAGFTFTLLKEFANPIPVSAELKYLAAKSALGIQS